MTRKQLKGQNTALNHVLLQKIAAQPYCRILLFSFATFFALPSSHQLTNSAGNDFGPLLQEKLGV